MDLKEAFENYFKKLNEKYQLQFNSLPTVSWDENYNQSLFISEVDEDGEIQWQPKLIENITLDRKGELTEELITFYSSYYHWQLHGRYNEIDFYFENCNCDEKINQNINMGLDNGEEYFSNNDYVLIGYANYNGNDDLLIFYDKLNNNIFLYDSDLKQIILKRYLLVNVIENMEPLI